MVGNHHLLIHGDGGENGGNRTHEFYESWQRTKPIMLGNLLEGEIYQAIELMNFTKMSGGYAHENAENLANIIETGNGYNFGQAEGMGREFWNEFEQFCVVNLEKDFYAKLYRGRLTNNNINNSNIYIRCEKPTPLGVGWITCF